MAEQSPGQTLSVALVQLLGDLAWPAVALYVIYTFRAPLIELLKRLASLKVGDNEFLFQKPTETTVSVLAHRSSPTVELGADSFLTVHSIHSFVADSGLLDEGDEVKKELLIFQTPQQRTWLVSTRNHMFLLLDSEQTRGKLNVVQTFFDKNNTLPLDFTAQNGAGAVKFAAEKTWWYYSLHLFPSTSSLNDAIRRLIQ